MVFGQHSPTGAVGSCRSIFGAPLLEDVGQHDFGDAVPEPWQIHADMYIYIYIYIFVYLFTCLNIYVFTYILFTIYQFIYMYVFS